MEKLPRRKNIRLRNYDYSKPGYYFVTMCTYNMQNVLCTVTEEGLCSNLDVRLSTIGEQVKTNLLKLPKIFSGIIIEPYVIMPNHIHFVVQQTGKHGSLPLYKLLGQFKSYTTRLYGKVLWQRNYYDRVIRNEKEHLAICEYIKTNPLKWRLDRYYKV